MKKNIVEYSRSVIFVEDVDALPPVPIECPVCEQFINSIESITSYRLYECCAWCKLKFVDKDKEKWESGWRPSQSEVNQTLMRIDMGD